MAVVTVAGRDGRLSPNLFNVLLTRHEAAALLKVCHNIGGHVNGPRSIFYSYGGTSIGEQLTRLESALDAESRTFTLAEYSGTIIFNRDEVPVETVDFSAATVGTPTTDDEDDCSVCNMDQAEGEADAADAVESDTVYVIADVDGVPVNVGLTLPIDRRATVYVADSVTVEFSPIAGL